MMNEHDRPDDIKDQAAGGPEADGAPEDETAGFDAEQARQANAAIRELGEEVEELRDRVMRAAAEAENVRRRAQRDVADARTFSIAGFARDMLGVSDNLARALQSIPDEARHDGSAGFTALIEGVELTQKSMQDALAKHGVQRLEPEGERFDPNFHQAMFEVPNTDVPNNTVVQVVQAGYRIGERVLRPAMVGVSKGGPKAAAEKPASADGADHAEPGPPDEVATRDA